MKKFHRKSIRLKNFDYSSFGAYFITICTYKKYNYFGEIFDNKVKLSPIGKMAKTYWREIPSHFKVVNLDEFIIMPNHIHGILKIENLRENNTTTKPKINQFQKTIKNSISSIIQSYKAALTRWCKKNNQTEFKWQRNYYEHVIRNDKELHLIQQYIMDNPIAWKKDKYNSKSDSIKSCFDQ